MNKLLGTSILFCLSIVITVGTAGCQKPAVTTIKKETAPPPKVAANEPPAEAPVLKLDREKIELIAGGKPEIVNVLTKKADSVSPGKNGVKAEIKKGAEGRFIELSADKDAKPGVQELHVKYLALAQSIFVTVKNGKKDETKKDEVKKDEPKKDDAKKDDAKKDDVKKEDAKKDEAKNDSPKKDEPKKDEPKKDESKKDDVKTSDARRAIGIEADSANNRRVLCSPTTGVFWRAAAVVSMARSSVANIDSAAGAEQQLTNC